MYAVIVLINLILAMISQIFVFCIDRLSFRNFRAENGGGIPI